MGRISEAKDAEPLDNDWRNKVDDILDDLEDDADRAVVLSWLHDKTMSDQAVEDELFRFDIVCSDSTVRQWRRRNRAGRWAA